MGAAVAAYREAVRRDPTLADARLTLADALAGMGEHEGAIAELTALLQAGPPVHMAGDPLRGPPVHMAGDPLRGPPVHMAGDPLRVGEKAARNREILQRALEEMKRRRLLGKGQKELEASALLGEGGFRNKGPTPRPADGGPDAGGTARTLRYAAPLVELYACFDEADAVASLLLVLTDPERAARAEDDTFKVTVVAEDGRHEPADFATAITLTFLREALGCPMTQASTLYARLLGGEAEISWGGATLAFASTPRPDRPSEQRHGVRVARR